MLTVRKDSTALVDSEIGMKLKNEGKRFFFGTGSVSLSSAIRSYTQITNPKQQANAKKFLQNVLVWALLTQRRCMGSALRRCHLTANPAVTDTGMQHIIAPPPLHRSNSRVTRSSLLACTTPRRRRPIQPL